MGNDFSKGKVWRIIIAQSIPLILAQLVQLLYNVVDRVYIGHLPEVGTVALTGVGLAFPLTTLIAAFTNLFGTGGTPLFSIARGAGDEERAKKLMGNTFVLLVGTSIVLFALCYGFRRPVLYLFGASDATYAYADLYLKIYLFGTTFSMVSTGMNGFINAQGFPKIGMMTTLIGAVLNLILDPIFIFGLHMGVGGAALATIISQAVSAIWVLAFLRNDKAVLSLKRKYMKVSWSMTKEILSLGTAGFMVQGTNCAVQIACNMMLKAHGGSLGDIYVGVMTIINSVRDITTLPIHGLTNGAQPVLGFNYGAKQPGRVKQGIRFMAIVGIVYTFIVWGLVICLPNYFLGIFTSDQALLDIGRHALKIYFFGFCFMSFQFSGQATFTGLGFSKRAVFFSLFRKAIIVVPLTIFLPLTFLGVDGVFWAEPISNLVGGTACFTTMYFTVYRRLKE
ncbi:MAG: MATE family efflux transporter [Eubacteriales bacterium]|nr:MATE family efflux transporter [Eubacteriales bacterium]